MEDRNFTEVVKFHKTHYAQLSRSIPVSDSPLPPVAPEAKVINNAATSTLDNGSKTLPNGSETLPNGSKMLPQGSQNATPTTIENNSYTKKNKAPLDKGDFNNWKDYAVEVCPGILCFKLEQLKVPKAYEPLVWEAVEIFAHMGEAQLAGIKNPQLQEKMIGKIRATCGPDLIRWGEELRDKYHLAARDPLEAVKFLHSVLEPYFAPAQQSPTPAT